MIFNSFQFAIFLPVVFAIYWLLGRWKRWQNAFILAASYFFYGCWDWRFLVLIIFTSGVSYLSGLWIGGQPKGRGRWVMWGSVAVNLAILGVFKYYDFFAQSFADLFLGGQSDGILLHLVLPVGISFYTFQALSYSIDVYRGTMPPTRDVVAYFAYVAFFPQLVAGPIERASNLLPQFMMPRRFSYPQAVDGMRQMLWGYFKKMVVADSCAVYADMVFKDPGSCSAPTLWMAAVAFSIQIYGDFSGYSDIAIGSAKLFGIRLRRNFHVPYFSRDIAEFWRRWHISLTTWFRDYVYIPLGGSRVGRWRVVLNTFVIFLLSGLWHGANWTFVAWGLYHAALFLPLILTGRNRRHTGAIAEGRLFPRAGEAVGMAVTFVLAAAGWVVFRSETIGGAVGYLAGMNPVRFFTESFTLATADCGVIIAAIPLMAVVEWVNRECDHPLARLPRRRWVRWAFYITLIFLIVAFMQTHETPFIYFQF